MRPLSDWADLKYAPGTATAHVVPFGSQSPLCSSVDGSGWYGTGTWDEAEHAQSLALCVQCVPVTPAATYSEWDAPAPLYMHTETRD